MHFLSVGKLKYTKPLLLVQSPRLAVPCLCCMIQYRRENVGKDPLLNLHTFLRHLDMPASNREMQDDDQFQNYLIDKCGHSGFDYLLLFGSIDVEKSDFL